MDCPVCKNEMLSTYRSYLNAEVVAEKLRCYNCGKVDYENVHGDIRYVIRAHTFHCGDPKTVEGNLMAWNLYAAIQEAKEEWRDETKH